MRDKCWDNRPTSAAEMRLIRIGDHLRWSRKRKEWPVAAITRALQAVWDAKEAVRKPLRKAWLETLEKRKRNLPARTHA